MNQNYIIVLVNDQEAFVKVEQLLKWESLVDTLPIFCSLKSLNSLASLYPANLMVMADKSKIHRKLDP